MPFAAGMLNNLYEVQSYSATGSSDAGDVTRAWTTDFSIRAGRRADIQPSESRRGMMAYAENSEILMTRYRPGITPEKRLLRRREGSTITAGINSSDTTVTIAAALKFDGGNIDYLKIGSEILHVTAGSSGTTLTVERGALETTAASHSANAVAVRVEKLEIEGVERSNEADDELLVRVRRDG